MYTINYLMDQRVPSYPCSMIDHCAAEIAPELYRERGTRMAVVMLSRGRERERVALWC